MDAKTSRVLDSDTPRLSHPLAINAIYLFSAKTTLATGLGFLESTADFPADVQLLRCRVILRK